MAKQVKNQSFFDYSDKKKKEIISKAAIASNKAQQETVKRACNSCYGLGLWAIGAPAPMGPIDGSGGMPTIPCPECGANRNPLPRKVNVKLEIPKK